MRKKVHITKLDKRERGIYMYKLVRARKKERRDLGSIKCIKGEDYRVIVLEEEIKVMWKNYFCKL